MWSARNSSSLWRFHFSSARRSVWEWHVWWSSFRPLWTVNTLTAAPVSGKRNNVQCGSEIFGASNVTCARSGTRTEKYNMYSIRTTEDWKVWNNPPPPPPTGSESDVRLRLRYPASRGEYRHKLNMLLFSHLWVPMISGVSGMNLHA